jgi:hypothetical protein
MAAGIMATTEKFYRYPNLLSRGLVPDSYQSFRASDNLLALAQRVI